MKTDKKKVFIIIVLITVIIALSLLSILFGSVKTSFKDLLSSKNGLYIVKKIRLPRTIGAILTGACLACSGLIFQTVFKNPMADSYMLGISSSASFSVGLAMLILNIASKNISLSVFAFIGSIICTLFLFSVNKGNDVKLILTGMAINFFCSAATTVLIYLNRQQLENILFWTMGSMASMNWQKIIVLAIVTIFTFVATMYERNTLDILLMDDSTAQSSGVNVKRKKKQMLLIASLSTSVVVAYCGIIGFVGMLSSHCMRLLLGASHKKITTPTLLFGSFIVLLSDLISRTIMAPSELPIGVITSVLGAPVLFLLVRRKSNA